LDDARLGPFLPLIYIAWSDGDLTMDEVEGICKTIERHPGVDLDSKQAFRLWLDPDDPPTPQEYETLRRRLGHWGANEMARTDARLGLVTICGAGATAGAMILERD